MEFFWIDKTPVGRLATATRPRGEDWLSADVAELARVPVGMLVSMLTATENAELGLVAEAASVRAAGVDFLNIPIEDRGLPERAGPFVDGVRAAAAALRAGKAVAVHCRMGVGRSSMFAASTLIRVGLEPEVAWTSIARVRGRPVPDVANQREWVDAARDLLRSP
jgi:protein-tyrosine phosphatase